MVKVIKKHRKPPILTASAIPCLKSLPTINITQGCALGCTYCYIQSYPGYPGPDSIVLFENTAEVVREELKRKRKRPTRVYFSPSSDAFQYIPAIQDVTLATMQVLLEQGIEVAFLTKGFVKRPFLDLFRPHARLVYAQIGMTSLDRSLWRRFEPRTAPPDQRIQTMRDLRRVGVAVTVRLDPLIPDLTDTATNLEPLLAQLQDSGIEFAAASYLFIRPGLGQELPAALEQLRVDVGDWQQQSFAQGCGGGRMLTLDERRDRFAKLEPLGQRYGIAVRACHCKNPELADSTCQIAGRAGSSERDSQSQELLPFGTAGQEASPTRFH